MCPPNAKVTSTANKVEEKRNNGEMKSNTNASTTTTPTPTTTAKSTMHPVVQAWSKVYNMTPKIYIPFTNFDIGLSIVSCILLSTLRLINQNIFTQVFGYNPNTYKTIESAACLTSITHAIILCHGLWATLTSQPYVITARMEQAPQVYQDAVTALLQFCTGYMTYDAIFMFRENNWSIHPDDAAFLAHHIVTILYMSQCRVLGVGHISAMGLMFTGEITNPLQNGHMITKYGIQLLPSGSLFHIIHPYVELAFSVAYFLMRAIVGPIQITHIAYHLLFTKEGRKNVPLFIGILWSVLIFGIIGGSIPWTMECVDMITDGLKVKYDENFDYGPRYEL